MILTMFGVFAARFAMEALRLRLVERPLFTVIEKYQESNEKS